jgi:hypothetical protein
LDWPDAELPVFEAIVRRQEPVLVDTPAPDLYGEGPFLFGIAGLDTLQSGDCGTAMSR